MNRDRIIAKAILDAQVASDGGKGIREIMHMNKSAWYRGYDAKDIYIEKALTLINSDRNSTFIWSISPTNPEPASAPDHRGTSNKYRNNISNKSYLSKIN